MADARSTRSDEALEREWLARTDDACVQVTADPFLGPARGHPRERVGCVRSVGAPRSPRLLGSGLIDLLELAPHLDLLGGLGSVAQNALQRGRLRPA